MSRQLIQEEEFTSVQEAQAGITRLFRKAKKLKKFYRVMRNQEPLGVLVPNDLWLSLIEDLEALSSSHYLSQIEKARKDKGRVSSRAAKRRLGLR